LSEPIRESELRAIGQEIHQAHPGFQRTFIAYWLPDMVVGTGAWATTHYNPELEVRVLGMSVEQEKALRPTVPDSRVIGHWRDRSQVGGFMTITRDGSATEFVQRFTDGSELRRKVREQRSGGTRRFEPTERVTDGEYYILATDGWLEIHDDDGLIKRVEPFN
jgi:hypothetical protein